MSVVLGPQIPVEVIGGLVTDFKPEVLPPGVSPDCADIVFGPGVPGSADTRPGTSLVHSFGDGNLNYMATFTDPQGNNRNLYLDDDGSLWQEFPQAVFSQVNAGLNSTFISAPYGKSATAFGREFIAFHDGKFGINIPRQWDGTNFDRVSSSGPGAPCSLAEVFFSITAISRTSNVISLTTDQPHNLTPGSIVNIQGNTGDPTLNGQYPVATTPTASTLTAWGVPGKFSINSISRKGGVVRALLETSTFASPGDPIIVGDALDPSFDGLFTISAINGNTVQWAQAGPDTDDLVGGTLYTESYTIPITSIYPAINPPSGMGIGEIDIPVAISNLQLQVGNQLAVTGNTHSAYNATWVIQSLQAAPLNSGFSDFPYNSYADFATTETATGLGGTGTVILPDSSPSASGNAGLASEISTGIHKVSVSFIMRSGYITRPSYPTVVDCLGGFVVQANFIPLGPPNIVVGRILMATVADGDNFFYSENNNTDISAMQINDNATSAINMNFSDLALSSAVSSDYLFDNIVLPEVAGFIQYGERLLAWGARNVLPNWDNLDFDGGSKGVTHSLVTYPLGWTSDPTYGGGGRVQYNSPVWGGYYTMQFGGTQPYVGMITQSAYQDHYGVTRIQTGIPYSVRVLLSATPGAGPATGNVVLELFSATLGSFGSLVVPVVSLTQNFQEFSGQLTNGIIGAVPSDLVLRLYGSGNTFNNWIVNVENVEPYPTLEPFQNSTVFGSNVEDPETFQGTTGFVTVAINDGRRIVSCGIIRDRLFMAKNIGGIYSMTADASAQFADWDVNTISESVGCESVAGIGTHTGEEGEDWFVIFSRSGLYAFWSTNPPKISQEIQPTWDQINWNYAHTAWVIVDIKKRRILVGVPTGSSTSPNKIYYMDYKLCGESAEEIAGSPSVSPTYTGELRAHARSRKWAVWNLVANSAALIERNDGTAHLFLGDGDDSGNAYDLLDSNLADVDGPINGYYITGAVPSDEQKQDILKMQGNRALLRYLTTLTSGIGKLQMTVYGPGFVNSYAIPAPGAPALALASPASQDIETLVNFSAERMFVKFQASHPSTPQFSIRNAQLYLGQDPCTPLRGFN